MLRCLLIVVVLSALTACAGPKSIAHSHQADEAAMVTISRIRPDPAYFEKRGALTRLNFDFELQNSGAEPVEITFIGLRVYDEDGRVLTRRSMGGNGLPGPIAMLPNRTVMAGSTRYVFNPFPDLALCCEPASAQLVVGYSGGVTEFGLDFHAPPGPLLARPPLDDISFVFSGNDLFAHHRRVSLDSEAALALEMDHVAQRFALDFTRLDPKRGDLYANGGIEHADWFGFGAEIFAPAAGRVVAVRASMPDNMFDASGERVFIDDFEDFGEDRGLGNYILLELEPDAFLLLTHFRVGTISLSAGDSVEVGDRLGEIGLSGDTAYPHLHIQLQDGPNFLDAKPLPISFQCVRAVGTEHRPGAVDSGDFVSPCEDGPAAR